jgi:hypothetical protein
VFFVVDSSITMNTKSVDYRVGWWLHRETALWQNAVERDQPSLGHVVCYGLGDAFFLNLHWPPDGRRDQRRSRGCGGQRDGPRQMEEFTDARLPGEVDSKKQDGDGYGPAKNAARAKLISNQIDGFGEPGE